MFRAEGVTKSYDGGKTFANRDVSIEVHPGEVYGLRCRRLPHHSHAWTVLDWAVVARVVGRRG